MATFMVSNKRLFCKISRDTFKGKLLESIIPLTNLKYCGKNASASSMINTRCTYNFKPRALLACHKSKGARAGRYKSPVYSCLPSTLK